VWFNYIDNWTLASLAIVSCTVLSSAARHIVISSYRLPCKSSSIVSRLIVCLLLFLIYVQCLHSNCRHYWNFNRSIIIIIYRNIPLELLSVTIWMDEGYRSWHSPNVMPRSTWGNLNTSKIRRTKIIKREEEVQKKMNYDFGGLLWIQSNSCFLNHVVWT